MASDREQTIGLVSRPATQTAQLQSQRDKRSREIALHANSHQAHIGTSPRRDDDWSAGAGLWPGESFSGRSKVLRVLHWRPVFKPVDDSRSVPRLPGFDDLD